MIDGASIRYAVRCRYIDTKNFFPTLRLLGNATTALANTAIALPAIIHTLALLSLL